MLWFILLYLLVCTVFMLGMCKAAGMDPRP